VEVAANYEASKEIVEQDRPIEPVTDVGRGLLGLGRAARALGDDGFFVGVTMAPGIKAARERAARIATVMLESI
jgi:hypothetical protein